LSLCLTTPTEDAGRKILRNVGILPHHYTHSEDGVKRFSETLISCNITTRSEDGGR